MTDVRRPEDGGSRLRSDGVSGSGDEGARARPESRQCELFSRERSGTRMYKFRASPALRHSLTRGELDEGRSRPIPRLQLIRSPPAIWEGMSMKIASMRRDNKRT